MRYYFKINCLDPNFLIFGFKKLFYLPLKFLLIISAIDFSPRDLPFCPIEIFPPAISVRDLEASATAPTPGLSLSFDIAVGPSFCRLPEPSFYIMLELTRFRGLFTTMAG